MVTTLAKSGLSSGNKTKRLHALLWGPPGSWKTVMAHGMPNTRTIDFDDGMQSVEWAILAGKIKKSMNEVVFETILPTGKDKDGVATMLDKATDVIDKWLEEESIPENEWEEYCKETHGLDVPYPQHWDTLIIDSASGLNEAAIVLGLKENNRLNQSESWKAWKSDGWRVRPMRIQDWGSAGHLEVKFIEMCRAIGKNVIVIAHQYENTDDKGTVISYDPLLIGQNRQLVPKDFDEVWYAHITGTRQEPVGKIQTTNGGKRNCGSRLGCLNPIEVLNFYKFREKVAKFYGIDPELLWTAAATEEEVVTGL